MRGLQCLRVLAVLAGAAAVGCGSSQSNAGADGGGASGSADSNAGEGGSAADAGGADGQADGTIGSDAGGGADGKAGSVDGAAADQAASDQGASDAASGTGPGCDGAVGTSWDAAPPVLIAKNDYISQPELGVDRLGNAVVVWEQQTNQQVYAIWASSRPAGGAWQAPTALSNEDHPAMGLDPNMIEIPPQLAVSDNGTGVAVWPMHFNLVPIQLQASHFTPGQGWDGPVVINALPADAGVDRKSTRLNSS